MWPHSDGCYLTLTSLKYCFSIWANDMQSTEDCSDQTEQLFCDLQQSRWYFSTLSSINIDQSWATSCVWPGQSRELFPSNHTVHWLISVRKHYFSKCTPKQHLIRTRFHHLTSAVSALSQSRKMKTRSLQNTLRVTYTLLALNVKLANTLCKCAGGECREGESGMGTNRKAKKTMSLLL